MIDEITYFYLENEGQLDKSFYDFCFNSEIFKSKKEAEEYYTNDTNFVNFIKYKLESKRSWG